MQMKLFVVSVYHIFYFILTFFFFFLIISMAITQTYNSKSKIKIQNINKQKNMIKHLVFSVLLTVISYCLPYNSSQPVWLVSPYFRAGNQAVISTLTGNNTTPQYTFTFSSALSGIPNLGYGIKNYRGNDTMINQCFQIQKVSLSTTAFTVSIQIRGFTNLWLLAVPYIAIDSGFPHHLNSFSNVPLNYSSGPLTNFSTQKTTQTSFTEYINYTSQAAACNHKVFQLPLSSNKIILYITSLYIFGSGTSGGGSSSKFPINLTISYNIFNTSHYSWTAYFGINATVTSLRFSQIVFNSVDVQGSNLYKIQTWLWTVNQPGQWQAFPQELIDNMIVGLQDFASIDGACGFQYQWQYANSSSVFGIQVQPSVPKVAYCGFSTARSNVFYIKTWQCSVPYIYFNLTVSLCQNQCGDYYIGNTTSQLCQACYYPCQSCSLTNSSSSCTQCDTTLNRVLISGSCTCSTGYFDDGYDATCISCSSVVNHCSTCTYALNSSQTTVYYQSVFASSTWATDILPNFTCSQCNTPYFLSSSTVCTLCTVSNCITCSTSTTCQTCATSYFVNSTFQCQTCPVANCQTCYNITSCQTCTSPYFVNSSYACELCTLSYCVTCTNLTACQTCDSSVNATLTAGLTCMICNVNNCISCSSNNYCSSCQTNYSILNGSCFPCGDGIMQGSEQCDDGNTVSNDGCSSTCTTQYCGNGIVEGSEQCDQGTGTVGNGSGSSCYANCTLLVSESSMFIPPLYSKYAGYGIFLLGFKIVGMQMLAVIQNFQLILQSNNDSNFLIDMSCHGYINQNNFFFKIKSATHLLTYFNFMFLGILVVFVMGMILQWIGFFCSKNQRKIANTHKSQHQVQQNGKKACNSQQISSQNSSQVSQDFVVHRKTQPKGIKQIQTHEQLSKIDNNSQIYPYQKSNNLLYTIANIVLKQILMNLIINELYIFTYGISRQINITQFQYIINLPTVLIFCVYFLAFVALFWYLAGEDVGFGQNQLKFKKGSWIHYWGTVNAERLSMGAALSGGYSFGLWAILAIKIVFIFYHMYMRFFQKSPQFKRSMWTHGLHLLLIIVYIFNVEYFQDSSLKQSMPLHIMEYLQIAILLVVVIIAVGFIVREVVYNFQADYRNQEQQLKSTSTQKQSKVDELSEDSSHSFHLSKQHSRNRNVSNPMEADNDMINVNVSQIATKPRQNLQKRAQNLKKTFLRHKRVNNQNQQKSQSNAYDANFMTNQSGPYRLSNISIQNQIFQRNKSPKTNILRPQEKAMNDQYKQYINRNNNPKNRRNGRGVQNNTKKDNDQNFNPKNQPQHMKYPLSSNPLQGKSNYLSHGLIKNQRPMNLSNMYADHLQKNNNKNMKRSHMNIINTHRSDESQQFDDKISIKGHLF